MSTYSDILTAIDTAIETWVGRPKILMINGRRTEFHSLDELISTRKYYAKLVAQAAGKKRVQVMRIVHGGPQD